MNPGIDLGTTFSIIAQVNAQGVPALFPDLHDANQFQTPSVVHVAGNAALVGQPAESLLDEDPSQPVARFFKLKMGSPDPAYRDAQGREWPAEALSALVLRKLVRDAKAFANEEVEACVVCVPAQFGDAQRRATKDAAVLAGLPAPELVEEPVAAATFYGMAESRREQTIFVYDLGGGTFDATVLATSPKGLYVLATDGCSDAGGKRVDDAIMQLVAEDFRKAHGIDPRGDGAAEVQLRKFAERVKVQLGLPGRGQVSQLVLLCGKPYEFLLTRSQFERLIAPLVERTIEASNRCLKGAGLSWKSVDKLLLAGGSTLIPFVQQRLRKEADKAGDQVCSQQPRQAVAYGAAAIASRARRPDAPAVMQRIASHDLGLRVWDKASGRPGVQVLVQRNTPLPARHTTTIYTTREDQTRIVIEIVQSKGEEPSSLGNFAFGPIAAPRKNYPLELTVAYDVEGIVKVTARDPRTGQEMQRVLEDSAQSGGARLGELRALVQGVKVNE
jgi:molecular chaperone DnaK